MSLPNYTVIESSKAQADIAAIAANEAINPVTNAPFFTDEKAQEIAAAIQAKIDKLGNIPNGGTDVPINGTTYQRTVEAPFNIYWITDDDAKKVIVHRVIHGSRDQASAFRE